MLPGVESVVAGSYRRGQQDSGDIDILLVPPVEVECFDILGSLLPLLTDCGFLTDHLTMPSKFVWGDCSTYMGVCTWEGHFHRIDIKVIM